MGRRKKTRMDAPASDQLLRALVYEEAEALRGIVKEASQKHPESEDLRLLNYLLGLVVLATRDSALSDRVSG